MNTDLLGYVASPYNRSWLCYFVVGNFSVSAMEPYIHTMDVLLKILNLSEVEQRVVVMDDREDIRESKKIAVVGNVCSLPMNSYLDDHQCTLPAVGKLHGLALPSHGEQYFCGYCRFERDKDRMWKRSPWMVSKDEVALENFMWSMGPDEIKFDMLPIWIRNQNFPFNCLKKKTLTRCIMQSLLVPI
jgi:hypothetical protein